MTTPPLSACCGAGIYRRSYELKDYIIRCVRCFKPCVIATPERLSSNVGQLDTPPPQASEWENVFFKVYGEPILNLYEDAYKHRYPDLGKASNVPFEAGMDFQSAIKDFIRQLILAERESILEAVKLEKKEKSFVKTDGLNTTEYIHYSGTVDGHNSAVGELNAIREKLQEEIINYLKEKEEV